jgi:hypothetical protein
MSEIRREGLELQKAYGLEDLVSCGRGALKCFLGQAGFGRPRELIPCV